MWSTFSQVAGALIGEEVEEAGPPAHRMEEKEEYIDSLKQTISELELKLEQKDKEIEEQTTRLKLKHKARVAQLQRDHTKLNPAGDHDDSPASRGKVLLLKKQLEECRRMAARPPMSDAPTQTDGPTHDPHAQELYAQMVYKDSRILELINHITDQERSLLDLQEALKEKDEVLQARTKAVMLLKEDLGRRGETAESDLEATRLELREMQEKFSILDHAWQRERSRLEAQEAQLKAEAERLDTARYNMAATNAELQKRLVLSQQDNLEQLEEIKRLTTENEELRTWEPTRKYEALPEDSTPGPKWSPQLAQLSQVLKDLGYSNTISLDNPESIQYITLHLKKYLQQNSKLEDLENYLMATFSISSPDQLHERLEQEATAIGTLKRELEGEKSQVEQLQDDCIKSKQKIEELEEENDNLVNKIKDLSSKLDRTQHQLEDQSKIAYQFQDQLDRSTEHYEWVNKSLNEEVMGLQEQLEIEEKLNQNEKEANNTLRKQLEETRQKDLGAQDNLEGIVTSLQQELFALKAELASKCLEVESFASTLGAFEQNLNPLLEGHTQHEQHKCQQELLQGLHNLAAMFPGRTMIDLAASSDSPTDYNAIISQCCRDLHSLTAQLDSVRSQLHSLEEENETLKLSLKEQGSENEANLEKTCKELQQSLASSRCTEEELRQELDTQTTSMKDLSCDIKSVEVELNDLCTNILSRFHEEGHQELSDDFPSGTKSGLWQCSSSLAQMKEALHLLQPRLQQWMENLEQENETLKLRNKEVSDQLEVLTIKLEKDQKDKETVLAEYTSKISDLTSELEDARKKLWEQGNHLEAVKNLVNHSMEVVAEEASLQGSFDPWKEALERILTDYSSLEQNSALDKKKLNILEAEVQNLYTSLYSTLPDSSEDCIDFLRRILKVRLEEQDVLKELQRQNANLEENIQSCKQKEMTLQSQASSLLGALEESKQEREALWAEIAGCKQQNTDLSTIVLGSQEELNSVKTKLEQVQALSAQIENLNQENSTLNQRIDDLKKENALLSESLQEKEKNLNLFQEQLKEGISAFQALDNEKEASLNALDNCLKIKDEECNSLRSHLETLEASMLAEHNQLESQHSILVSKVQSLERELEEKESLLRQYSAKIDKLKEEGFQSQKENDFLQKEISILKECSPSRNSEVLATMLPQDVSHDESQGETLEEDSTEKIEPPLTMLPQDVPYDEIQEETHEEDSTKKLEVEHLVQKNKEATDQEKDPIDNEQPISQLTIAKVKMNKMLLKLKAFKEQNDQLQAKLESSLEEFNAQKEQFHNTLVEKDQVIGSLNQHIEHQHSHSQYETGQLRKEITELNTLLEVMEEKTAGYKQTIKEYEAKMDELHSAMRFVVQEKTVLEGKVSQLQDELESSEEQGLGLKQQLLCVEGREKQLQQRHSNAEELNKLLMTDNQNYQSVLQDLQTVNQRLELQLAVSRPQEKQDELLLQLTQENQRLGEESVRAKAELRELTEQRAAQLPEVESREQLLESQVGQLQHQNTELSAKLEKVWEEWRQQGEVWRLERQQLQEREEELRQELSRQPPAQLYPRLSEIQPDILASHGQENMALTEAPSTSSLVEPSPSSTTEDCRILIDRADGSSSAKSSFFSLNLQHLQSQASRFLSRPSAKRFY